MCDAASYSFQMSLAKRLKSNQVWLETSGLSKRYSCLYKYVWRAWLVAIRAEGQPLNNEFTSFEAIVSNSNFEFTQTGIIQQKLR